MSSFNVGNDLSLQSSDNERTSKNSKAVHKKKQIISQRVGSYRYIYLISEKGQKVLLTKVPIKTEEQKIKEQLNKSDETKTSMHYEMKDARTAFEYNQQLRLQAAHKKNLQDSMDIVKEAAGVPSNSSKDVETT